MNRRESEVVIAVAMACVASIASAQLPCDPLPPPVGPVIEMYPADASSLRGEIAGAAAGTTILLHDGAYDMSGGDSSHRLIFSTPDVTLRSASGDRDAVILDGNYGTNELISIHASDVTIADITLMRAYDHPIHASGPLDTPISGILIHNVRIVDPGQQAIKVNPFGTGTVDSGTLECSHLELTDTGRTHIRDNCYTGGLDAHAATGWLVRRNLIEGFWCDLGLSEHGIHMWNQCVDTVVEENLVIDCARGIGFGLGAGDAGHTDGVIRNNFVAAGDANLFDSESGFDSGISVWGAENAVVVHNTVASTEAPFSSIEWRYIATSVAIANNLVSGLIRDRGGTAYLSTNIEYAPLALFVDVPAGDLHLADPESPPVDEGTVLTAGLADDDFDGQVRDSAPDIGADEVVEALFGDGFESGDLSRWSASIP